MNINTIVNTADVSAPLNVLDALAVVWMNDETSEFRKAYLIKAKTYLTNRVEVVLSKAELEYLPSRKASELRSVEQRALRDEQTLKGNAEFYENINNPITWAPQSVSPPSCPVLVDLKKSES